MKHPLLTLIALIASLLLNALFIAFTAFALTSPRSGGAVAFDAPPAHSITAAALVTVSSGSVTFGPFQLSLPRGESAAVQFSAVQGGKQANWLVTALYDHSVIAVDKTSTGILITALEPGSTVMQTVTEDGIQDIAAVTVTEAP